MSFLVRLREVAQASLYPIFPDDGELLPHLRVLLHRWLQARYCHDMNAFSSTEQKIHSAAVSCTFPVSIFHGISMKKKRPHGKLRFVTLDNFFPFSFFQHKFA